MYKETLSTDQINAIDELTVVGGVVVLKAGVGDNGFSVGNPAEQYTATGDNVTGDFEDKETYISYVTDHWENNTVAALETASSASVSSGTGASNLLDGSTATRWLTSSDPATAYVDLVYSAPVAILQVAFRQQNEAARLTGGVSKIEGSNGGAFTTISTTDAPFTQSSNALTIVDVSSPASYTTYRFTMYIGGGITDPWGLSEAISYKGEPASTDNTVVANIPLTGTVNFSPSTLIVKDAGGTPISTAEKVNVEWEKNDGGTWSDQEDLLTFQARSADNIIFKSVTAGKIRLQPVGSQQFSDVLLSSATSSNLLGKDGTFTTTVGGDEVFNSATATTEIDANTAFREDVASPERELLLTSKQLVDGSSGGIAPAILAYISVNPADGETLVFNHSGYTLTYTFKTSPSGGADIQIGATASATQTNMVATIISSGGLYNAIETSVFGDYFSADPSAQVILWRKAPNDAQGSYIYGTAGSDIKLINFGGSSNYLDASGTEESMATTSPSSENFGLDRSVANVAEGEAHSCLDDSSKWTLDAPTSVWNQTGGVCETKLLQISMPLSGVVDSQVDLIGAESEIATEQTGDYATDFGLQNQHLHITVNTITTGGDIVITGVSNSESSGVPTVGDTETITVDTTEGQEYQSSKKWLKITNIDISTGAIVSIDYDIGTLGYLDMGNTDWTITGYRMDIKTAGDSSDLGLVLTKVQDDGDGKHSHVTIEDYGHDSQPDDGEYIDDLRTAGDDRSYDMDGVGLAPNNTEICYKCLDFNTFFTSDENKLEGTKDEGLIVHLEGKPSGGISQIDHITLNIYYTVGVR